MSCPVGGEDSWRRLSSSCLWSVVSLVLLWFCWLFLVQLVFFLCVCVFFFLYIPVPKASVPAVSCHRFMQGLHGPFPESPVIQLHSWLLHSLTHWHTHSNIHFLIDFLQTCNYSVSHSFEHSLIHPAIHPIASQDGTNLAVRQISATHVNSPLLVHLIWADHYIPFVHSTIFMSSPSFFPFICRLSTHSLVQSVFLTLVCFAWSSCNPILDIVQLVQNRRHKGLVVFVVVN